MISSAPRAECATLRLRLPEEEQGSGCSAALSLALQYKSPSTRTWSIAKQHLLAGSEVVVDGLDAKLAYSYRLIAFNQAGGSEPSEVVGPVVVGMKEGFADSQPVPPWPCHPWPAPSPHRARTEPADLASRDVSRARACASLR